MTPIHVLFGTETYNSQDLAERTGEAIAGLGLAVEVLDMADVELDALAGCHTLLIITSTFGDGEPPSNAAELHEGLMHGGPALGHLRYAVLGLGDSSYPRFCQCAQDFDRRLGELGGRRLLARVDCDVDYEGPFAGWLGQVLQTLQHMDFSAVSSPAPVAEQAAWPAHEQAAWPADDQAAWPADEQAAWPADDQAAWPAQEQPAWPAQRPAQRPAPAPAPAAPERPRHGQSPYRHLLGDDGELADMATHAFIRVAAPPVPPPKKAQREPAAEGTRKNPFVATVLENYNLNGPGSDKETRHVVFSLKGSDLTYTVGDALGVVPNNCPDLVRRIIQGSALRGDEEVDVGGELLPLRAALGYRLDCVTVDQKLLRLAARDAHPQAAGEFQRLLDDDEARKVWLTENHVIDVVEAAWMRTDPQELVRVLKPLGPRLYSISSSPLAHPGEVHLTVDVVRYEMRGRTRKGTSSTFIGERCGPGVRVPIFVQSAKFGLTDDDYAPIIMVGPGTGIAPFRAFLEEREARRAEGYSWLIFGARSSATDFLYREQIAAWQASGVLTRFDAAFSRDQGRKVYVQDRMREHGADLFAWLEAGSCFYVCGDAARMARDVNEALLEIISVYGGYDRAGAEAYLARMQAEGRYLRDVY